MKPKLGLALLVGALGLVGVVAATNGGGVMEQVFGRWFKLRELIATRHPVDNTPSEQAVANLKRLVADVLDPLREALGRPMRITSGFRSAEVNRLVDGAAQSQHLRGEAVDFKVDGVPSADVVAFLVRLALPFDQAIWYDPSRGGHVHVSHTLTRNRGEVLHARAGGGYVPWTAGVA